MKEEEETQGHGLKAVCLQRQGVYRHAGPWIKGRVSAEAGSVQAEL